MMPNDNRCCHSLYGCHVAIGDVAPELNVRNEKGRRVRGHVSLNKRQQAVTAPFTVWWPLLCGCGHGGHPFIVVAAAALDACHGAAALWWCSACSYVMLVRHCRHGVVVGTPHLHLHVMVVHGGCHPSVHCDCWVMVASRWWVLHRGGTLLAVAVVIPHGLLSSMKDNDICHCPFGCHVTDSDMAPGCFILASSGG
jgi:hypothetical protein